MHILKDAGSFPASFCKIEYFILQRNRMIVFLWDGANFLF